jgi:hypothetical protein
VNRKHGRRQQIFVDLDRRHRNAIDRQLGFFWRRDPRCADAARGDERAALVEQRDLAELAKLQDVVLEDAVLLPGLEAGVLQIGGECLQQFSVGQNVAANLLGGAQRDVLVAGDHRLTCAALERDDRDHAVGDQRQHGGRAEQQREARRDVADSHDLSFDWPAPEREWVSIAAACSERRGLLPPERRNVW